MLALNQEQLDAATAFVGFMLSPDKELVLSGGAGTGKTTLLKHLMALKDVVNIQSLIGQKSIQTWRLTATTNKAAEVLQASTGIEATTVHSLLGLKVRNDFKTGKTIITRGRDHEIIHDTLIVIDECSMVDSDLRRYINESTMNCKILYVGDHCQLAPVMETLSPVFADNEALVLNQVMRSIHTPAITALCQQLRQSVEDGIFRPIAGAPGTIDYLDPDQARDEIVHTFVDNPHADARILCYTNDKVVGFNNFIRGERNLPPHFTASEWVVSNTMSTSIGPANMAGRLRVEEEVEILEVSDPMPFQIAIRGTLHELPIYLVSTLKGQFRCPVDVEEYRQLVAYLGKQKDWVPYFFLKENIADLRPRDACTVYKAQGSTYHTAFVDLADIGRCTQPAQAARMLYVACSRATHRICFIGQLPDRFRG